MCLGHEVRFKDIYCSAEQRLSNKGGLWDEKERRRNFGVEKEYGFD